MKMAGGGISDEAYVASVQRRKIWEFLESIDATLKEINKKLDGPKAIGLFTAEATIRPTEPDNDDPSIVITPAGVAAGMARAAAARRGW